MTWTEHTSAPRPNDVPQKACLRTVRSSSYTSKDDLPSQFTYHPALLFASKKSGDASAT